MNYKREVRDCFLVEMNTANVIAKPLKEQQELDPCRKFALNMWGHMFLYHHNARHSLRKVSTLYELLIMSNSLEFYLKGDNIVDLIAFYFDDISKYYFDYGIILWGLSIEISIKHITVGKELLCLKERKWKWPHKMNARLHFLT